MSNALKPEARSLKPRILLVVAAALINPQNEILLAQRPEGKRLAGKWEFPGGKVEAGESPEAALVRELHEELGIHADVGDLEPFWFLSHDYVAEFSFHLLMPVYLCRSWQGMPHAKEHAAIAWKHPKNMHELPMIEADAELVEKAMQDMLKFIMNAGIFDTIWHIFAAIFNFVIGIVIAIIEFIISVFRTIFG